MASQTSDRHIDTLSSYFVIAQPVPYYKPVSFKPVGNGQCVALVQAHGFEDFRGNAIDWVKYISPGVTPAMGDAILLREGRFWHLAIIIGFDGGYNLVEQNYEGVYTVSYRTISKDYDKIVGIIPKR